MIGKRFLGAAGAGVLCGALGVLAACGNSDSESAVSASQALASANVSLTLHDASGAAVGTGSGVLIAPRLVLTSGHLVAGKAKWTVRTADGKTATGTRGLTKDWMVYNSMKAHPRKNDVAVIYLDREINLPAYPKLATTRVEKGADATRVRHTPSGFDLVPTKLDRIRSFPNSYVAEIPTSETLDTGGAVVNAKGEIVGLVSSRGLTTGQLYIARVDGLAKWLSPKVACAGGAQTGALNTLTYGAPPPKPGCTKDGGAGTSSSGGDGDGTGSSSGGDGDGTGSSSGGTDGDGKCDDGGGVCSGDCSGSGDGSSSSSGGTDGSSSGGSSGSDGATSSSGGSSSGDGTDGSSSGGDGTDGSSSGGSSGSDGTTSSSGGSSSGGDGTDGSSGGGGGDGTDGTTSSSGGGSGSDDTTSSGGGGSGSDGDEEVCEGEYDNPDVCPPEPDGCSGPSCGGGQPDDFMDYGNCACSTPPGTSGPIILR
jgi:hypothetical protein